MTENEEPSWWEMLKVAEEQRKEIQEVLEGPDTLSSDDLDYLSEALSCINEAASIAKRNLGLPE